jgi:hypothetical protein
MGSGLGMLFLIAGSGLLLDGHSSGPAANRYAGLATLLLLMGSGLVLGDRQDHRR